LKAFLLGEPLTWLFAKLNAASWFSQANKLYNSGQRPYREEPLSPWAMALACEGLSFLAGGASRRLGARARAQGAFPFVTDAVAPETQGELGRDLAEFWGPIWERPMTVPEVRALFARGRAELSGRGALTPSAFATAIVRRGVDAGIVELRRFVLGRTTSAKTFEPRYEGTFRLTSTAGAAKPSLPPPTSPLAAALDRVQRLIERLPRDAITKKSKRFVGLRGPVEVSLLQLVAAPQDSQAARALLDAIASALDRVDRNRGFREKHVYWEPLPIAWLPSLFAGEAPAVEARLALALVSGFPRSRSLALYRFGIEWNDTRNRFEHPSVPPARWTWGTGPLPRVMAAVQLRRCLDWQKAASTGSGESEACHLVFPASCSDVSVWLQAMLDEELLARWISRLALFDWRFVPSSVRSLAQPASPVRALDRSLPLFGLFAPLFDLRPVIPRGQPPDRDLLNPESGARTPSVARLLANLIRGGRLDAAVRAAGARYAMARAPVARTNAPWQVSEPERLLASLLFPVSNEERSILIECWLRPQRQKEVLTHG
jgi:CRISPR-associated protein Csx17